MIQRIQSVYLLLAAGALGGQFALPYLATDAGNAATQVPALADGVLNPLDNIGLLGLTALGIVVTLGAIFLFRNRPLQGRLVGAGVAVGALLLVLAAVATKGALDAVPATGSAHWGAGWATPVLALVLQWLALRGIRKDEQLVRSMDRLR